MITDMGVELAKIDDAVRDIAANPPPEPEYSGFPFWHAMLVPPNREEQSAHRLKLLHTHVYLPQWPRNQRCRGKANRCVQAAVIPGMLFVPVEYFDFSKAAYILEIAQVRGFLNDGSGSPAQLLKSDIEIIREIEAKLNIMPQERAAVVYEVGQRVRFLNELYAAFWGTGTVTDLANGGRVGVEVANLFGRPTKVYVPAAEIEAM